MKLSLLAALAVSTLASFALAHVVNAENQDVQVLQAWSDVRQGVEIYDLASCTGPTPGERQYVIKDCTQVAGIQGNLTVPVLTQVTFHEGRLWSSRTRGNLVEIRVVVPLSVLNSPVFTGIGFWATGFYPTEPTVTPREQLEVVSTEPVYLKNGEEAAVLRFVHFLVGTSGNSGTGWGRDSVSFKPFAQYEADGVIYRNWEAVSQNHNISRLRNAGGSRQVDSFNRENELLRK